MRFIVSHEQTLSGEVQQVFESHLWMNSEDSPWVVSTQAQCLWGSYSTMQSFIEGLPTPPPCIYLGPTSISLHWNGVRSCHPSLTLLQPQWPCFPWPHQVASASRSLHRILSALYILPPEIFSAHSLPCLYCLSYNAWSSVWPNQPNLFLFVVLVAKSCLTLWNLHGL